MINRKTHHRQIDGQIYRLIDETYIDTYKKRGKKTGRRLNWTREETGNVKDY